MNYIEREVTGFKKKARQAISYSNVNEHLNHNGDYSDTYSDIRGVGNTTMKAHKDFGPLGEIRIPDRKPSARCPNPSLANSCYKISHLPCLRPFFSFVAEKLLF